MPRLTLFANGWKFKMSSAVVVDQMTLAYGDRVIQRELSFAVETGQICVIVGGSGCGKSTLLRHMLGLAEPTHGSVSFEGQNFTHADQQQRMAMRLQWGVTFQQGGLISAMSLAENLSLPLEL